MPDSALPFEEMQDLLASRDIQLEGRFAKNIGEALHAADKENYPVVLKAQSSEIIHKTDIGAVALNLKDVKALKQAYANIMKKTAAAGVKKIDGFIVQKMAENGFELFIGARQDPVFGPITMIGRGGRFVELMADASPGIGILREEDVLRMLSETMAGIILDGFRGPALDKAAAVELCQKVSRLMAEHPEIHELDLNPVIVYEKGFSIVDARLIKGDPVSSPQDINIFPEKMKSLDRVLNPASAAVIGASRPGTMGGIILKNCMRLKKLYPINPQRDRVQGLKCYHSLQEVPEAPDAGIFIINAEATVKGFEEFCKIGGKGAIILSDGFAEIGRFDLENRLMEISKKYGVAYIGPNCLGAINNYTGLNTFFIPEQRTSMITKPNGIGILSQSGGIGVEIIELMKAENLKLGMLVSCGNASGIGVPELLEHMGRDPRINIIAIYLEGIKNGRKMIDIGKRVSREKPVLIIKGGIGGGAAATLSHTASLAGSIEAFRACCHQAGFYLIEELTEDPQILVNTLSILTTEPMATGDRVAVVSVGGGAAILLADQITANGMRLAEFDPSTKEKLGRLMGAAQQEATEKEGGRIIFGAGNNPVDLLGDCDDDRFLTALKIIDEDPNADGIVIALYLQVPNLSEYLAERLVDLKNQLKKPMIISARGFSEYAQRCRGYLHSKGVPTYTVPVIKPLSIALRIWQDYKKSFCPRDEKPRL